MSNHHITTDEITYIAFVTRAEIDQLQRQAEEFGRAADKLNNALRKLSHEHRRVRRSRWYAPQAWRCERRAR